MHYLVKSNYIFDAEKRETFSGYIEVYEGTIQNLYLNDTTDLPNCPIIDYSEQMMIPSFIDAHVHFYLSSLIHAGHIHYVSGVTPESVAQKAGELPIHQGWRIGIGWYASDFGQQIYPDRWVLDTYTGSIPTMLISGDAHTVWFNTAALQTLAITSTTIPNEISGERLMKNGELSGVFLEAIAIYYIAGVLEKFKAQAPKACLTYMAHLNKMGITAVGDVALTGESPDDLVYPELYRSIESEATVRMSFYPAMRLNVSPLQKMSASYQSPMLQMGGVKQFFDGVTSSHTALLKEPYYVPYGEHDVGTSLLPIELMHELILLANQADLPIRIHAIGDRAIQLTLTYLQEAQMNYPLSAGKYNTVEHLEVMDPIDLPLTRQTNLVLSVQPSHLLVGYDTLDCEVGPERARNMFPFQSFIQSGATLAFGTDTPVVLDITPLQSIYYAVARQTDEGLPTEALMPEERMTIGDALYAHTQGAAKALSRTDIGNLSKGKRADFVILNRNLLNVSAQDIFTTEIVATYLSGNKVYDKLESN